MWIWHRKDDSVNIDGLTPEMMIALERLSHLWYAVFPEDVDGPVVTSAKDGKHGTDSLHYSGNAIDLRTRDVSTEKVQKEFMFLARFILGKDYDIIFEGDHLHVEFDPKTQGVISAKTTDGGSPTST